MVEEYDVGEEKSVFLRLGCRAAALASKWGSLRRLTSGAHAGKV